MLLFGGMMLCMRNVDQDALKEAQEQQQDAMGGMDPNDPFGSLARMLAGGAGAEAGGAAAGGAAAGGEGGRQQQQRRAEQGAARSRGT